MEFLENHINQPSNEILLNLEKVVVRIFFLQMPKTIFGFSMYFPPKKIFFLFVRENSVEQIFHKFFFGFLISNFSNMFFRQNLEGRSSSGYSMFFFQHIIQWTSNGCLILLFIQHLERKSLSGHLMFILKKKSLLYFGYLKKNIEEEDHHATILCSYDI